MLKVQNIHFKLLVKISPCSQKKTEWYVSKPPSLLYQVQQQHFKDGLKLGAIYNAFYWNQLYVMHSIAFICHVFHGKDLSLNV